MKHVRVNLGDRSYSVAVGHGARQEVQAMLPASARRVVIVSQVGIPEILIPQLNSVEVTRVVIGNGESFKTLATIESLCRSFAQAGLTRNDAVIAVGGGMVTDVAGFAAASYHRGIPVIHVATTLLAMIDAAIGGKTGVNIAEGKNLVGAFWQPHGVACDMDALATLPESETRCGNGEMSKYHFIVREDLSALDLESRIARCVQIKAEIVESDEREGGRRALLNYGHTLAHALEIATDFSIPHGIAVSVGLLFAAHLANDMGRISDRRVEEHYEVVHGVYGLRTPLPVGVDGTRLVQDMGRDKKALGSLTFVLDSDSGLEVVTGIEEAAILRSLDVFAARLSK